jgi:lipoprotein-anchoring transpeptidase ErfK/SrfK
MPYCQDFFWLRFDFGILWAGLNRPGIGIHGSPVPEPIGRAGSHGCICLSN